MKFLVTGTKGFIGKAVLNQLVREKHDVTEIDDILMVDGWKNVLESILKNNFDAVFHIGACSDTQNYDIDYVGPRNIDFTFFLADKCKERGIPLIFSSSASIYGNKNKPETLYAWSKYIGEKYVIETGGVALRYFNVYGYDESHKGNMASFLFQALKMKKAKKPIKIFPNKPTRDFVYIKDVVSANISAFENYQSVKGGVFDVGTGISNSYETLLEIANLDYSYTDQSMIPKNYQYYTCANKSKFLPNWSPKWNLQDGVVDYLKTLKFVDLDYSLYY